MRQNIYALKLTMIVQPDTETEGHSWDLCAELAASEETPARLPLRDFQGETDHGAHWT
jgi:hypothetical protein